MDAITIRQLKYVTTVARCGSFTAASEVLHLSQPAVGLQVKLLEESLGMPLFRRHSRGVQLTEAGEAFLPHASKVLDALAAGTQALTPLRTSSAITFRLGVTPSLARTLLPTLLYRSAQPDAKFRLTFVEGFSEPILQQVETGELDAALGYAAGPDTLARVGLFQEKLCVVGPSDILPGGNAPFPLSQLNDLPLVLTPRPDRLRSLVEASAVRAGVTLKPTAELKLEGRMRDFLLRYNYCALSPRGLFMDDIRAGRISGRPLAEPEINRVMKLHMARHLSDSHVAMLAQAVQEACAELGALGWEELFWTSMAA